jgi:pimeloyl-ACP methyl ester carboxylesterase
METTFLDVPGGRLSYDVTGPAGAPLVLCAPGMGNLRSVYRFLVPQLLDAGYRVATMDLRGAGESSVRWADYSSAAIGTDLIALVRHLGGPAILVTNSYSAASGVVAAATAPELVAGLVLTGPFVRDPQDTGLGKLMMKLMLPLLGRFPSVWLNYVRGKLYVTSKPADLPRYLTELGANLREPGRLAAFAAMMRGTHAPAEAALPDVTCPVLVVMGTRDPDFPDAVAEARWIERQLAGHTKVTVVLVDGAGHYPATEAQEQTGGAVRTFLAATLA